MNSAVRRYSGRYKVESWINRYVAADLRQKYLSHEKTVEL